MSEQMTTFFSYSRTDSDFTVRLARDLRAAGQKIWLDQLDIAAGERWDDSIQRALTSSKRLLVILSPASVGSQNVMDEVSFALEEGRQVIPVLYQQCEVPFRLRRLQHIDFTRGYDDGLARARGALESEQGVAGAEPEGASPGLRATGAGSSPFGLRHPGLKWAFGAVLALLAAAIVSYQLVVTPPPPVARFSATPASGGQPLTVTFVDQSSGDIEGIRWEFGDGGSSQERSPSHTYAAAGEYTARLTIDGPGGADSQVTAIKVMPPAASAGSGTVTQQTEGGSSPAVANVKGDVTINIGGGSSKD